MEVYPYGCLTPEGQRRDDPYRYAQENGIVALVKGIREDGVDGQPHPLLVVIDAAKISQRAMCAAWDAEAVVNAERESAESARRIRAEIRQAKSDLAEMEEDNAEAKRRGMRSAFDADMMAGTSRKLAKLKKDLARIEGRK